MNKLLEKILVTRRCHNSQGELAFAAWLHGQIKTLGFEPVSLAEGCISVEVDKSRVLFSCHIDTCHSKQESDTGTTQNLSYDELMGHVFVNDPISSCLGADDGVGVYIMLKMLEAKVPGSYIFHRGEEKGGIGSRAVLAKHKLWLDSFDACIAFDRPNCHEIIITQGGLPCASNTYGEALAKAFNDLDADFKYEISHKGMFTDSKVYAYVIPECINIGVGYTNQHTKDEYLNVEHAEKLMQAAIKLDWAKLPITRVPPEEPKAYMRPPANPRHDFGASHGYYGLHGFDRDEFRGSGLFKDPVENDFHVPPKRKPVQSLKPTKNKGGAVVTKIKSSRPTEPDLKLVAEICAMDYDALVDYIGDSELAKAFIHMQAEKVAAVAKSNFLVEIMGLDV